MFPQVTAAEHENVITYRLFLRDADTSAATGRQDLLRLDVDKLRERCGTILQFAEQATRGFLWHRHKFHVHVESAAESAWIEGATAVGDAIQDEWVVVHLVFALTKQFPDVVAQLYDTDGDLLLIEAADVLPDWATPQTTEDRVFVKDGQVHLVPWADNESAQAAASKKSKPGRARANIGRLQGNLRRVGEETKAGNAIQRVIQLKLDEVPQYVSENRHRIRCVLPERAARVVLAKPEILGAAVEAFYYRDPNQTASVCNKMDLFLPPDTQVVERMVTFSRCMFAQLKQQQFHAPKPFLRHDAYQALSAPASSDSAFAAEMGMKLSCGLELLFASDESDQFGHSWRDIVTQAVADAQDTIEPEPLGPDDDDSWLYIHPESLEETLLNASRNRAATFEDESPGGAEELEQMASMFNNFMSGISGLDGVEDQAPIQFDMSALMQLLNNDAGADFASGAFDDEEDDEFYGEYDDDDDDDSEVDSDDEDAAMSRAMQEMENELADTHMAKSFVRFEELDEDNSAATSQPPPAPASVPAPARAADNAPLDLDFNLLSNLLESFASQEGQAGPVTNMLHEMGFKR